jgi:hypothetical protein
MSPGGARQAHLYPVESASVSGNQLDAGLPPSSVSEQLQDELAAVSVRVE